MRVTRARKMAVAVTTVLFASLLAVAPSASATSPEGDGAAAVAALSAREASSHLAPRTSSVQRAPITAAAATGTVTGTITGAAALTEPVVVLMRPDEKTGYYRWTPAYDLFAFATAGGTYSITDVPVGTYSAMFFDNGDESIALQFLGGTYNLTQATSFAVTASGTTTGINATLAKGALVSGKVTTAAGKGLASADVYVARKITVDGKPFWEYSIAGTEADGTYAMDGIAPGTIAVRANGPSGAGYVSAYYGGGTTFEGSKTFSLASGQSRTGVNIALSKKLTVGTPSISGTAVVGGKLTAKTGTWTKGTTFRYQWLANGSPISRATASSYTVSSSMKGKNISVRVTGTNPNYTTGVKVSKATAKVAVAKTPTISGTAKVGKKLTAKTGTWTAGTTFSYRWYANGTAISKATKSTFTLTKAQKGKRITVKVTGTKSGYATVTKTSKSTAKVG